MSLDKRELQSFNPSTGQTIWTGIQVDESEISRSIAVAKTEQKAWEFLGVESRKAIIRRFAELLLENSEEGARTISEENGKPFWEAKTEIAAVAAEAELNFAAYDERARTSSRDIGGRLSVTRFKPHGVMAVIGPFNFPMSMPNLHIMPALLAGNTAVFKPSGRTPKVADFYLKLWREAGLPEGVLQIVNGGGEVAEFLLTHPDINGVLFVGSRQVGVSIEKKLAEATDKIRALEMGGNNPLVIWDYDDINAALFIAIQSAYISSGQRCSAARRLIVNRAVADEFAPRLKEAVKNIVVGDAFATDPEPFMGPLIDQRATEQFLSDYQELVSQGVKVLVPTERIAGLGENFVRPALVDGTGIAVEDKEIFGPLLQLIVVGSLDEAIAEANKTQYGLSAGIVTQSRDVYEQFLKEAVAGVINWNQPITGASTAAPFGGVKASGNHRPTGFLSVDYCSYAVASIETEKASMPDSLPPGLEL